MTGVLANFAALHQAYWQNDAGYRRAWYIWPQASSLLALLLIFNPIDPGAAPEAPWVKPVGPGNNPAAPATAQTAASQADQASCRGANLDAALAVCAKLIETLPRTDSWLADAYFQRARIYNQKGRNDLAIADLTQAIAFGPPGAGSLNFRGWIYLEQGNNDLGIADFLNAIAAKPAWALPHANLGFAYLRTNNLDRAIVEANEAVRLDPQLAWAKIVRMRVNDTRKQYGDVIADATAVIAAAPNNAEAFYWRGVAKVELSDYGAALTDLAEATRLGYKDVYLDLNKAYANQQLGNLDQALLDYTAALKLSPKSIYALQKRAEIYFNKGLYADALSNLATILGIDPKNYDALVLRAKTKMRAGSNEEALQDLDAALSQRPADAETRALRGEAYLNAELATVEPCKKYGQPTADKSRWVVGGPARAYRCQRGPDITGAIKEFDEALRLKPDLAWAYADRGTAYFFLGNRQQAATDWRMAYKLNPNDEDTLARMRRAGIKP